MKIYVDVSVLTLATFITGIQRVTRQILVELFRMQEAEIVLLHYNAREDVYHKIDKEAFLRYYVQNKGKKERMVTKQRVPLSDIAEGSLFFDIDAVWMCRVKRSFLYPVLKKQGVHIVSHIYDIISIEYPQFCLERGVYNFMDYIGACLQYADCFIVNAQATKDAIKELAGKISVTMPPCHVVPLGADYSRKQEVKAEEADASGPKDDIKQEIRKAVQSGPYILMVGTIEPRKNHKLLLEAYDKKLKDMGYHIIFAGYLGWNMEEFAQTLADHPDKDNGIYHFEGLDDTHISYLYQNARYLAFLSYSEGFGLPLIEAFYRGTPVIASDIPVSREVAGEYCVYCKQDDIQDLCNQIKRLDEAPDVYQRLKERLKTYQAITWKESARRMYELLKVLGEA